MHARYYIAMLALVATTNHAQSINSSSKEHPSCASLRSQLAQIDEQARQRSTAYLTEQRRKVTERMSALGCSFMG